MSQTPDSTSRDAVSGKDIYCQHALERMHEFLDHELDTASGDAIRQHLVECEPCLDQFDVEQAVKTLVNRCCGGDQAPLHLRTRIVSQLTVTTTTVISNG